MRWQQPFGCAVSPPYDYDEGDQVSQWAHWIAPHWAALISLGLTFLGALWKAASLFNELKELRKDQNRTTAVIEKFLGEYRTDSLSWRTYVDSRFNAVNDRLDNLADK